MIPDFLLVSARIYCGFVSSDCRFTPGRLVGQISDGRRVRSLWCSDWGTHALMTFINYAPWLAIGLTLSMTDHCKHSALLRAISTTYDEQLHLTPPPSTSTSSHCSPRCHVPYSFRRAIHVKNYLNSLLSQQAVGIDVIINFKIGFRPTQRTQHRNRHLLANRTWGVRTMRATIARKEINRASIARALMNSRNDRK